MSDRSTLGAPASVPMVDAVAVSKSFGSNEVLKSITLQVQRGEVMCVIGPSGSGKSTFLRCINHLERIDAGRLSVEGELVGYRQKGGRLYELKPSEASLQRRDIGMVFQHFNLFPHMTVLDNLMLAPMIVRKQPRAEAEAIARRYLEKVRIPEQASKFPGQLSGGQQQRVAIARALAMDPQLMLFDEPTSALDPEMIREVLDVMRDLARDGMTMLVVTHEMGFAREVCDRLVFIDGGQIVEEGPPAEFFANAQSERAREFVDKIIHH